MAAISPTPMERERQAHVHKLIEAGESIDETDATFRRLSQIPPPADPPGAAAAGTDASAAAASGGVTASAGAPAQPAQVSPKASKKNSKSSSSSHSGGQHSRGNSNSGGSHYSGGNVESRSPSTSRNRRVTPPQVVDPTAGVALRFDKQAITIPPAGSRKIASSLARQLNKQYDAEAGRMRQNSCF
jgi:hypothetical protein